MGRPDKHRHVADDAVESSPPGSDIDSLWHAYGVTLHRTSETFDEAAKAATAAAFRAWAVAYGLEQYLIEEFSRRWELRS